MLKFLLSFFSCYTLMPPPATHDYLRSSYRSNRHVSPKLARFVKTQDIQRSQLTYTALPRKRPHYSLHLLRLSIPSPPSIRQEAQLSQRGRAMLCVIENLVQALKIAQGHWKWYHLKAWHGFTLAFHRNYGPIWHHFWDKAIYWSKIAIFSDSTCIRHPR